MFHVERRIEQSMQIAIGEHRGGKRERARGSVENIDAQLRQRRRLEIENAPRARAPADRAPVVDFTRIDADEVTGRGFDLAAAAPRGMATGVDDTDAVLIVRMPRKSARRGRRHRIDAGERKSVKGNGIRHRCDPHSYIVSPP
jgi:hypothetical protein